MLCVWYAIWLDEFWIPIGPVSFNIWFMTYEERVGTVTLSSPLRFFIMRGASIFSLVEMRSQSGSECRIRGTMRGADGRNGRRCAHKLSGNEPFWMGVAD